MSPLCKRHRSNPDLTERFELFVNGKELCNAYSELNDPIDQLERFQEQMRLSEKGDDEAMLIDLDFVRALEYGMPSCSGMGIGIDRLTMFMTGATSIQDVLFFPTMRPEKKVVADPVEAYTAKGIAQEWVPVIQKMGYITVDSLSKLSAGKFFNDLCGFNKKNKLGLKAPLWRRSSSGAAAQSNPLPEQYAAAEYYAAATSGRAYANRFLTEGMAAATSGYALGTTKNISFNYTYRI